MKRTILIHSVVTVLLLLTVSAQATPYLIHHSSETNTTINSHSSTVTNTTINQTSTGTSIGIDVPFLPEIVKPNISFPDISFPDISPDISWPDHSDRRADRWLIERLKRVDRNAAPWKENRQFILFRWNNKTILAARSFSELTLRSWFTRSALSSHEAFARSNRWNQKNMDTRSWITDEFKAPRFWLQWTVPLEKISDPSWNDSGLRETLREYSSLIDDFVRVIDRE